VLRILIPRMPLLPFAYRMARWHVRYLLFRRATPLACGLYITSACNLKCHFCNIWRVRPPKTVREEDARARIRQLGALKLVYLSISGGEPLAVPYTIPLLGYAKECGILYTHVVSNGYLMNEDRAHQLADARVSEISFSLDGPEAVHDVVRGMEGSYRGVLRAIECVRAHAPRTRIVMNTILSPTEPQHARYVVNLARELGVEIKVQPKNDHPGLEVTDPADPYRRRLSPEEQQTLTAAVGQLIAAPHVVNSKTFLRNYLAFMLQPENLLLRRAACIYGCHHLESYGNALFPCLEGMNWTDGFDWSGRPVAETLASPEYQAKLRELRDCDRCTRNYYVCYYEPRLNFPLWNLVGSRWTTWRRGGVKTI